MASAEERRFWTQAETHWHRFQILPAQSSCIVDNLSQPGAVNVLPYAHHIHCRRNTDV